MKQPVNGWLNIIVTYKPSNKVHQVKNCHGNRLFPWNKTLVDVQVLRVSVSIT